MKKTLMVILALVMALTLAIGSVGTVSAAPPLTMTITVNAHAVGNVSFDYGWAGKAGVFSYNIDVYHASVNPLPHSEWASGATFTRRTTSQSLSQNLTSIVENGNYQVNLALYDRKGDLIDFKSVGFTIP